MLQTSWLIKFIFSSTPINVFAINIIPNIMLIYYPNVSLMPNCEFSRSWANNILIPPVLLALNFPWICLFFSKRILTGEVEKLYYILLSSIISYLFGASSFYLIWSEFHRNIGHNQSLIHCFAYDMIKFESVKCTVHLSRNPRIRMQFNMQRLEKTRLQIKPSSRGAICGKTGKT